MRPLVTNSIAENKMVIEVSDNVEPVKPDTQSVVSGEKSETPEKHQGSADTHVENSSDNPQREVGGRKGPEPTRYGDWEKNGRCIDF